MAKHTAPAKQIKCRAPEKCRNMNLGHPRPAKGKESPKKDKDNK